MPTSVTTRDGYNCDNVGRARECTTISLTVFINRYKQCLVKTCVTVCFNKLTWQFLLTGVTIRDQIRRVTVCLIQQVYVTVTVNKCYNT